MDRKNTSAAAPRDPEIQTSTEAAADVGASAASFVAARRGAEPPPAGPA